MDGRKVTAVFLSLFLLPGAGHWYLGRRKAGGIYAAWALIAVLYPLVRYARRLSAALRELAAAPPDLLASAATALHQAWRDELGAICWGAVALGCCWLLAAVDLVRRS